MQYTSSRARQDAAAGSILTDAVAAVGAIEQILARAKQALVRKLGAVAGAGQGQQDAEQFALHGLAWFATYVEALRQMASWADRLAGEERFGLLEQLILQAAFGEYLSQIEGGIAMSQVEIVRPADLGLTDDDMAPMKQVFVRRLMAEGNTAAVRARIAALIEHATDADQFGISGLDETHVMIRDQFRRFAESEVMPHAHGWHRQDILIPDQVIAGMATLGVFGLTIPEQYGGSGLGKTAMCVVSEELSRGYIGVGSLGTRAEIAAELIQRGGSEQQKQYWLPKIASGAILPTAVFTEPGTGSDLGSLRTRAVKDADGSHYRVTGNKTWITHAARADVMTLLVRTNPEEKGYKGLSMLLAEKPRGRDGDPFPAEGMSGGEIEVLGYRGMKEYEIGFDGFKVKAANLLGSEEGQGFKQLMETFESARVQTAARALGVGQSALELGLKYACERIQFGKPIFSFPRVSGKLAWMTVEQMIARQLTFFAAREKDAGRRCDLEAGMAKLLAARVAWANADNALQIHGGNGYAQEYPISRVLCDARILNIFEGAAEIQAQVIARRLLDSAN